MPDWAGRLPELPFGDDCAHVIDDYEQYADQLTKFVPSFFELESLVPEDQFVTKSSWMSVGKIDLMASGGTPMYGSDRGSNNKLMVSVQFAGTADWEIDGEAFELRPGKAAGFTHHAGFTGGESGNTSFLMASFTPEVLKTALTAWRGPGWLNKLSLEEPRPLPLSIGQMRIDRAFWRFCKMLDAYKDSPELLQPLKADETLLRTILPMFVPSLLDPDCDSPKMTSKAAALMRKIEEVAHQPRTEPLTVYDLERATGLSPRSLQYFFKRYWHCTPTQYVRDLRLDAARSRLCHPDCRQTVTQIALEFGFPSVSLFARRYQQRFGELPSEARTRHSG